MSAISDGPVVHQLGHAPRGELQDELDDRRGKLVARINSQIDKHRDVLKLSPSNLMMYWSTRSGSAPAEFDPARQVSPSGG